MKPSKLRRRTIICAAKGAAVHKDRTAWVHVFTEDYLNTLFGEPGNMDVNADIVIENFENNVAGFPNDDGPRIPVKIEDRKSPAGHIVSLKRGGDSVSNIYALVEFQPTAAEAIENGEWGWLEVTLTVDEERPVLGPYISAAALTNRPSISDLQAIQLAHRRNQQLAAESRLTVAQAADTYVALYARAGRPIRHLDAVLLARKRYPHLRGEKRR